MIKNFKKYIFFLFFYFFTILTSNSLENKIVVKVNDKIISSYEIKNKINTKLILRYLELNQTNIDKVKKISLQELINFRIKEKELSKYEFYDLEKIDITNQLNSISGNNIKELKKKFTDNNLNYRIFVKELKIQAAWQKLIFFLFQNKVKINEDEISNEIENYKSSFSQVKEYDLSELEVSFDSLAEKEKLIEEVQKKIQEIGFERTVSIYSESESAINNGQLGFINEKSLSKEIYEILQDLNEGDISEPLVSLNKVLFLKINKINDTKNENLDLNELRKKLVNKKKNDLFNLYSKSHLSKIKNNSYIQFQ